MLATASKEFFCDSLDLEKEKQIIHITNTKLKEDSWSKMKSRTNEFYCDYKLL